MDIRDDSEVGSIARELYIEATPETVFEVISAPEHVARWWPDSADYEAAVGSSGTIVFRDRGNGAKTVALTVLEVDPPHTFSFRWTHRPGQDAVAQNSLLVTFELTPEGGGTRLRFTETGFRELGWEAAQLESLYGDHVNGWNHFLPRLVEYAASLGARA